MQPFDNNKRINDRPAIDPATVPVSKKSKHTHESLEMKVEEAKKERGFIATDPHAKYQQLKDKCEKLYKKIQILQESPPLEMSDSEKNQKIYKQTQKLNKLYEETINLGIELELNVPEMQVEEAAIPQIPSESAAVVPEMEVETSPQAPVIADNSYKKQYIEYIKNLKTIEDFRNFLKWTKSIPLEYQKLVDEAFLDPAVSVKLNFIAVTDKGDGIPYNLILPRSLWKAHSDFFANLIESPMGKKTPCVDTISLQTAKALADALRFCTGWGIINLNVLQELWKVADKYQIAWLCKECDQFYEEVYKPFKKYEEEIEKLEFAVELRGAKSVSTSVVSVCTAAQDILKNNTLSQSDKILLLNQLNELADEFKLADLKFFAMCCKGNVNNVDINPDGSFIGGYTIQNLMDPQHIEPLKECLAMHNPWHSPKIVLNIETVDAEGKIVEPGVEIVIDEKAIPSLNGILEDAMIPVTVQIDGLMPDNLNEILQKIPKLQHLRIIFNCRDPVENPRRIMEVLKNNTTLSTLHLTLLNYDNRESGNTHRVNWPGTILGLVGIRDDNNIYAAERDISRGIFANDSIRKKKSIEPLQLKVIQLNMEEEDLDKKSLYGGTQSIKLTNEDSTNYELCPTVLYYSGRENYSQRDLSQTETGFPELFNEPDTQ